MVRLGYSFILFILGKGILKVPPNSETLRLYSPYHMVQVMIWEFEQSWKGFLEKEEAAHLTSQRILLAFLKLIPRRRGLLPDLHVGASGGYFYIFTVIYIFKDIFISTIFLLLQYYLKATEQLNLNTKFRFCRDFQNLFRRDTRLAHLGVWEKKEITSKVGPKC